jgi:hypothetical protein
MTRLLALLVVATTGCQVELEVDEVRLSYRDIEIEAINGHGAAKHSFAFEDLAAIRELVDLGAEVSFIGAELRATSGVDDMTFVDRLRITVAPGEGSSLPDLVAYDCAGSCDARGRAMSMVPVHALRATDYVGGGSIVVDLDLEGLMPGRPWTLDFDVVLSASLDYSLGELP